MTNKVVIWYIDDDNNSCHFEIYSCQRRMNREES